MRKGVADGPRVATYAELLASGYSTSALRHRVRMGSAVRIFRGTYVTATSGQVDPTDQVLAWTKRLGANAAVSHQTAAALHGLDSTTGWPSTPQHFTQAHQNHPPVQTGIEFHRSRTLASDQIVSINQVPATSRARTVIDLAPNLSPLELERVFESALRGPDPRRPHDWRTDVLDQLVEFIDNHPRQPGSLQLKRLLLVRSKNEFPTGSIAETAAFQAIRDGGFGDPVRQARIVAPDRTGVLRDHYLDGFLDELRMDIEVDGSSHDAPSQRRADLERDRRLAGALTVIRVTADEAINHPRRVCELIEDELQRRQSGFEVSRWPRTLVKTGSFWTVMPTPSPPSSPA